MDGEGPASKKPRTTNVVVEQAGQTDKLLVDQIADIDSVFEEVVHPSLSISVCVCVCVLILILQSEEWPLNWFCEEMFRYLFNPSWEVNSCVHTYSLHTHIIHTLYH